MHFITFPVATTNIFPLSNSKYGGQLGTEYNLKAREMVATNPDVKYAIGPSFIHSMDDFKVKLLEDSDVPEYDPTKTYDKGDYCTYNNDTYVCIVQITTPEDPFDAEHWAKTSISTSILQIDPGRAVVNGHFVESLAPVIVDLNLANAELKQLSQEPLYGNLSIGLKTYFSTDATMAGAMLVENTDNMYVGVQVVITKTSDFITPNDSPEDQSAVTADIKLADFTYLNGSVSTSSIAPNQNATRYLPSARIFDFDNILDDKYVSSENLVDRMFYTYSGKSGWCDSTGSLMIWDAHPEQNWEPIPENLNLTNTQAEFITDTSGNVHLVIPHKQQDAVITQDGQEMYYTPRVMDFPTANYATGASGIVNEAYTQKIKDIAAVINTYKQFTNGKQIMYLDYLSINSEGEYSYEFPKDLSNFNVGDYIVVRQDYTASVSEDEGDAPSTMYFVLPGGVLAITYNGTTKPSGVRLGNTQALWAGDGAPTPSASSPTAEELLEMFNYTSYQGSVGDYFELVYHNIDDTVQTSYYYQVSSTGLKTWSDAILLTGGIPLATEEQIGGFYNASTDSAYADAGYVYLDETGHLRLRDYALLRSGALAYQLGESFRVPSNQTLEYIQAYLDENVNSRVAFYTEAQLTSTPSMIDVYIPLPAGEDGTLNLYNLDSRFGTGVYIHFLVDDKTADYSDTRINIVNCEKIRIDNSITTLTNGPMINIFRSCLYYDAELINYVRNCDPDNQRGTLFPNYNDFTGFEDLTLWYARFATSDPDLVVNGMEVSQPEVAMVTEDIAFWDETMSDDNHYSYALRSITLSNNGRIIGCSLYVSNNSTQTVNTTQHVIIGGDFYLPQGSALNYPMACIDEPLKVTGTFTTAYLDSTETQWITTETSFTAMTGTYSADSGVSLGSIAFNSSTSLIPTTHTNVTSISGWAPGEFHIFYGGTTT